MQEKNKPCIIVVDEIDGVLSRRTDTSGDSGGGGKVRNSIVNQFLSDLDGLKEHPYPIIVIGTTNKEDSLDPAVVRPGRIEKKILINLPNKSDTRLMLEMHLKKINLDRNLTKEDGKTPTDTLLDQFTAKCYELKMSPASIKYLTQGGIGDKC